MGEIEREKSNNRLSTNSGNERVWESQIFAENRRLSQESAGNRRFLQKPVAVCLLALS